MSDFLYTVLAIIYTLAMIGVMAHWITNHL